MSLTAFHASICHLHQHTFELSRLLHMPIVVAKIALQF